MAIILTALMNLDNNTPLEENKKFCGCGCGREFDAFDEWGRERRFLPGHNKRKRSKNVQHDNAIIMMKMNLGLPYDCTEYDILKKSEEKLKEKDKLREAYIELKNMILDFTLYELDALEIYADDENREYEAYQINTEKTISDLEQENLALRQQIERYLSIKLAGGWS